MRQADSSGDAKPRRTWLIGIPCFGQALTDYVPDKYKGNVGHAFEGTPTAEALDHDLIVFFFRHWGGISKETDALLFSKSVR